MPNDDLRKRLIAKKDPTCDLAEDVIKRQEDELLTSASLIGEFKAEILILKHKLRECRAKGPGPKQ